MKFKSVPMLAVAIAGTAMILAACQAPSSQTQGNSGSSAQAQTSETPNTSTSSVGENGARQGGALPPGLKLTEEQKTKMREIQENYRSKLENIFTAEQKNELKAAREQGKTPRAAMQSINLTDSQKQQIKALRQSQRQEIDNVLTNEQKQQLQQMRQNRHRNSQSADTSTPQS